MNTRHFHITSGILLALLTGSTTSVLAVEVAEVASTPALYQVGGRLHPLLIHFPIALILCALAFELFALLTGKTRPSSTAMLCLTTGVVFAGLSIASGLANHEFESHGRLVQNTINWHKWLGILAGSTGGAALLLGCITLIFSAPAIRPFYFFALFCSGVLVAITGHYGGSIVYGEDYLTGVIWPESEPEIEPQRETAQLTGPQAHAPTDGDSHEVAAEHSSTRAAVFFATDIQPILEDRCARCHGPSRQRGGLRVDSHASLFAAKSELWVVTPSDPERSELLRRVMLPASDDDAMPPKGERLTSKQVALIRQWIEDGALAEPISAQSTPPSEGTETEERGTADHADDREAAVHRPAPRVDWDSIQAPDPERSEEILAALRNRGAVAKRVFQGSDAVDVAFNLLGETVTDADLQLLNGLEDTLVWLNLADTAISDAGLQSLAGFTELRRLHLQRTDITSTGVALIVMLPELHYLNLYGTSTGDAGLQALQQAPELRDVYLWQSEVTPDAVARFRQARPDVNVVFADSAPVPPTPPAPDDADSDDSLSDDS